MINGNKTSFLNKKLLNEIEYDLKKSNTEKDMKQPFTPSIKEYNLFSSRENKKNDLFKSSISFIKHSSFIHFEPPKDIKNYVNSTSLPKINENEKTDIETKNTHEIDEIQPIDLEVLYNVMINENIIQKLILNKNYTGLEEELQKFDSNKEILIKLLSQVDFRGNTPVMLTIILHCITKNQIFKDILNLLLSMGADFKKKDKFNFTPLDIAVSYNNKEIVSILYDRYVKRRSEKFRRNLRYISNYFKTMNDFYVEVKWKVHVPILSFLCPYDVCPIWKKGTDVRMDTSFVDFKNLSTIRNPNSFMMLTNNNKISLVKCDLKLKKYFNMTEELDDEEKELVINDILTMKRINGNFKLLTCKIEESLSFFGGKKIIENIHGFKAQKFELKLTVRVDMNTIKKIEYKNLDESNYLDKNTDIIKNLIKENDKHLKESFENGLHMKNKQFEKSISELEKEKSLKAYVWIVDNSPIQCQDAINLINSIAPANELMEKVRDFFEHPDVKKIVESNGFPIKIQIPYNIFIDFTISFNKYHELSANSNEFNGVFDIINELTSETRKQIENLKVNYKRRAGYANIR